MVLNLNFSKIVNLGVFTFNIDELLYSHNFYIIEDSKDYERCYLIDVVKNETKNNLLRFYLNGNDVYNIELESVYITNFSFRKDIIKQITSFLKEYKYITDEEKAINSLKNIDISYFEVRYNLFEKTRRNDGYDNIETGDVYCIFSKSQIVNEDKSYGAILEDINLFAIKRLLKTHADKKINDL